MADSSQKFIARNRAPRVQIEYDVELYGAEKKVQLPFVMGVMSDLLGKSKEAQPAIADRKFLEIDVDNFDSRMKAMAPRAAFSVPNTLTGEGNLSIDLTFESMADFSPGAIAAKVDTLRPLLEARNQLQTLMAYMDGKSGAEDLIERILQTPALLASLSKGDTASDAAQLAALGSLRSVDLPEPEIDTRGDVLAALADQAPDAADDPGDAVSETLASLAQAAPQPDPDAEDTVASALASIPDVSPAVEEADDAALASLRRSEVEETEQEDDTSADVLAALAAAGEEAAAEVESASESILQDLAAEEPEVLAAAEQDEVADILQGLDAVDLPVEKDDPDLGEVLQTLPDPEAEDLELSAEAAAVLDSLSVQEPEVGTEAEEDLSQLLGDLAAEAPVDSEAQDGDVSAVLDAIPEIDVPAEPDSQAKDILAEIATQTAQEAPDPSQDDEIADILGGLDLSDETETMDPEVDLQDLLGDLTTPETEGAAAEADLDDIFSGLEIGETPEEEPEDSISDVLADLTLEAETEEEPSAEGAVDDELEALLTGLDVEEDLDLDALLSDSAETGAEQEEDSEDALGDLSPDDATDLELDALLADFEEGEDNAVDDTATETATKSDDDDELDALLAGLDEDEATVEDGPGDLDDVLADLDLDSTETSQDADPDLETRADGAAANQTVGLAEPEFAYGTITADRPSPAQLTRRRFRIAIFGDFSGRSAKGLVQTGDALADRQPILLDPDTVEDVIESFASELVLPIGKDGGGIAVKLGEFDDLHPDELFDNVALFSELVSLRKQLQSGVTVEHASRSLAAWAAEHGTPVRAPQRQSSGVAVPADRRLSAFQQLIGDQGNTLQEASPIEDLLARIVGPHIRALPNPDAAAMQQAVDAALSDAMRLVLHHPEFQSIEAQWRSLDLIARSVEVDDSLEVLLYDVSAEELAADLAAQDDLTVSGLTRLLTEAPMDPELGRGGYSALIGLYAFEETPPHAELLGRIARVAAHVDAPFLTSLTPEFLKLDKKDRPPLVAKAWETLQEMPEAGHLGLASPRFLLRRPYGAKSDPVDAFGFEEFSETEGLRGMLWGNPVVLVTILLARSFSENGTSMQLGSIMSLGDMPFHTVYDQFGDQVALPCTERNIDLDKIAMANDRGVMAVSAVKGRDELRLTSFASVAGGEILGPWTGVPAPEPSPPDPREAKGPAAQAVGDDRATEQAEPSVESDLDDLGLDDLDLESLGNSDAAEDDDGLGDLDDLLASFSDDSEDGDESDDDEMDAELAALLADL